MTKITDFQECIGKTIQKIEDDDTMIKITFKDNSYIELVGDYGGCVFLCEYNGQSELVSPKVYERNDKKG